MRLASGRQAAKYLSVSRQKTRSCTGNLSIPEGRSAEMRIYGGTNTWWKSSGWVSFYT